MDDHHRYGALPDEVLQQHISFLIATCNAVSYAHHRGVLHNDLKLENVMVGNLVRTTLMDWGCATQNPDRPHPLPTRILDPRSLTSPFGSPSYMPPELAKGLAKNQPKNRHLFAWCDAV